MGRLLSCSWRVLTLVFVPEYKYRSLLLVIAEDCPHPLGVTVEDYTSSKMQNPAWYSI